MARRVTFKTTLSIITLCFLLIAGCGQEAGSAGSGGGTDNDTQGTLSDATAADSVAADMTSADDASAKDVPLEPDTTSAADTATPDAGKGDAAVATDIAVADAGTPPAAWFACTADKECVVFESACCDHCNGGKQVAVHSDHLAAAKAALAKSPSACAGVPCTEKSCAPGLGVCEAKVCVAKADPTWGKACKDLGEGACLQSKSCSPIYAHDTASACAGKGTPQKTFAGCHDSNTSCGDALTCGSKDGKVAMFMSTCLPTGWQAKSYDTCCKPASTCGKGKAASLTKICVRPVGGGTKLEIGKPVEMVVYPKGCMSSSCTKIHTNTCSVKKADKGFSVSGLICLEGVGGAGPCTADCNGGGFATCATGSLAAGPYVVTLGGVSLSFKVPSDAVGLCAGKQW